MRFIILILFLPVFGFAQKKEVGKAITTDGRKIILYDDGTFRYEVMPVQFKQGTQVQDTVEDLSQKPIGDKYQTSPYNKREWKSTRTKFSVWFDPKKWKLNLLNKVAPTEASFHLNDTEVTVYTERTDIDMETWIHNMKLFHKQNYPSLIIEKEEWRTVNAQVAYYIQWQSGDKRHKFQVYSIYAKGNAEILQMHAATPVSIVSEVQEHIMRLFTGLVLNEQ